MFLALLGAWAAGLVAWSVVGRLPFRVQGIGVIMLGKGTVFDVAAPGAGTMQTVAARPGESVHTGQLLGLIAQREVEAQRRSAAILVDDLRRQVDAYRAASDRDVTQRRQDLAARLTAIQADLAQLRGNEAFLAQLNAVNQAELKNGYVTREQVEQTFSQLISVQQTIRASDNQLSELRTSQLEFENQVHEAMANLRVRLAEAENTLREADVRLASGGRVLSPCDGNVVEVATQPGALVSRGDQLFVIDSGDRQLSAVGYLPINAGKQVLPGMEVEVSPTSIERAIYGTIRGAVTSVSALAVTREGLVATLGNAELATQMMADGAPIELRISLTPDPRTPSGLAWSSETGPPGKITAGGTAAVAIIVRRARPIDLVLPIERTWLHP